MDRPGIFAADDPKSDRLLDILITDETNTASEKAAFLAAVFRELGAELGNLHKTSYVHVHDARAAAWGYGGLTQQYRAVRKMLEAG